MSALALFDAVGLAPSLPGAKCRGRHSLFDAPEPGCHPDDAEFAERAALRLCAACPSLTRCRMWLEALRRMRFAETFSTRDEVTHAVRNFVLIRASILRRSREPAPARRGRRCDPQAKTTRAATDADQ